MNMDELIENIWTAEVTRAMKSNSNFEVNGGSVANNVNSQKQESFMLPRTLSQKTVDELWGELLKEIDGNGGFKLIEEPNLQSALGEITVEEFLQRAGFVTEKNNFQPKGSPRNDGIFGDVSNQNVDQSSFVFGLKNSNQNQGFHQQPIVRSLQQPKLQKILPKKAAFDFTSSLNLANNAQMGSPLNGVSKIAKTDYPIKTSMVMERSPSDLFPNSNLDTSPLSSFYAYGEGDLQGRKRSGPLEKVVERKQKRMIKNRESAARSRARKQAYTLELEAEVAKLKELNYELKKKQEEIMESQNSKIPEKMKWWGSRRSCLRRTMTGPW